jgi:hypothetical protein
MTDWLRAGGWGAWILLCLALPTLGATVLHAAVVKRWTLLLGIAAVLLPIALGAAFTIKARIEEGAAISSRLGKTEARVLEEVGYREANITSQLGGAIAGIAAPALIYGELKRRSRRRRRKRQG